MFFGFFEADLFDFDLRDFDFPLFAFSGFDPELVGIIFAGIVFGLICAIAAHA